MIELKNYEVWFVTGSQELYGEATLKKVAEDFAKNSLRYGPIREAARAGGFQASGHFAGGDLCTLYGSEQCRKLRWPHYVDAYIFAGKDVDCRVESLAKTISPSAHAIQPRPAMVKHRHGLHESQPISSWRPGVWLHWQPYAPGAENCRRFLARR